MTKNSVTMKDWKLKNYKDLIKLNKKLRKIKPKLYALICVLVTIICVILISQIVAYRYSSSGKKLFINAVSMSSKTALVGVDSKAFNDFSVLLNKDSIAFNNSLRADNISKNLSPFFTKQSDIDQSRTYKISFDVQSNLSKLMSNALAEGVTSKAFNDFKKIVDLSVDDKLNSFTLYSYKEMGIISAKMLKTNDPITDTLSYLDKSIPRLDQPTTLIAIATDLSKYGDSKLYEILDGDTISAYSYALDINKDYSGEQKILQLNVKYIALISKYTSPDQKTTIEKENMIPYAQIHFDLSRVDFILGDYTNSNSELSIAKTFYTDLQSIEPNYDNLVSLLVQQGNKVVAKAPASSTPSTSTVANNTQCQDILKSMNTDLSYQSDQINTQLAFVKQLIANQSNSYAVLNGALMGTGASGMIKQAAMTQNINSENNKLDVLLQGFDTVKSNYQDKLNGAGCFSS
jgi:hypothetical protein